jgi:hypothetical protein
MSGIVDAIEEVSAFKTLEEMYNKIGPDFKRCADFDFLKIAIFVQEERPMDKSNLDEILDTMQDFFYEVYPRGCAETQTKRDTKDFMNVLRRVKHYLIVRHLQQMNQQPIPKSNGVVFRGDPRYE